MMMMMMRRQARSGGPPCSSGRSSARCRVPTWWRRRGRPPTCGFDVLIACAFNYDAHTTEFESLGRIPVLKARMNADLHMAGELKNTGNGNLFVIFGEPDIDVLDAEDGQVQVRVNGVDVFHPNTGEVRSDGPEGIACWFIDTDYNQESFFVRQAYFLERATPTSR